MGFWSEGVSSLGRGACLVCHGRYAFYWNAFLLKIILNSEVKIL